MAALFALICRNKAMNKTNLRLLTNTLVYLHCHHWIELTPVKYPVAHKTQLKSVLHHPVQSKLSRWANKLYYTWKCSALTCHFLQKFEMINCLFSKDKKSKTDIYFQLGSWTVFRSNSNQFIIQTYVYERIIGIWNTDKKHKSPTIPKTQYPGHVRSAQANDLPFLFGLLNIQENFLGLKLVGTSHWITLNKGKLPCSNQILNQHHWTGLFWGELI